MAFIGRPNLPEGLAQIVAQMQAQQGAGIGQALANIGQIVGRGRDQTAMREREKAAGAADMATQARNFVLELIKSGQIAPGGMGASRPDPLLASTSVPPGLMPGAGAPAGGVSIEQVLQGLGLPALPGMSGMQFQPKPTKAPEPDPYLTPEETASILESVGGKTPFKGFRLSRTAGDGLVAGAAKPKEEKVPSLDGILAEKVKKGELTVEEALRTKAEGRVAIPGLTEGEKAVDKAFAKDYADFVTGGGSASVSKNIEQLKVVKEALKTQQATGPLIGTLSRGMREVVNPAGQELQDTVEEVVQSNLRLVLGAQFTEKEGERLIARAYNPRLGEEVNAKRIERLMTQIEEAAKAKALAGQYYEEHGTLKGFKGTLYTSASQFLTDPPAKGDKGKKGGAKPAAPAGVGRFQVVVEE